MFSYKTLQVPCKNELLFEKKNLIQRYYNSLINQNYFLFELNKDMVGPTSPAVVTGEKPGTKKVTSGKARRH